MQLIIVYIILLISIAYAIYATVKHIRNKNNACDGCSGCEIKNQIKKSMKDKVTKDPNTCSCKPK